MIVNVRYMAHLKQAAGLAAEAIELAAPCTLPDLLAQLAARHGEPLARLLLDAGGGVQPTLLVFIGERQVRVAERTELQPGDLVTILSPIAGG